MLNPRFVVWSAAENAVLVAMWPTDASEDDIARAVSAVAGRPMPTCQPVIHRALHMGLPKRRHERAGRAEWSPERDAVLRQGLRAGRQPIDLVADINALPGRPVANSVALLMRQREIGRIPLPPPRPAADAAPAPHDQGQAKVSEARRLLGAGHAVAYVAAVTKLPWKQVFAERDLVAGVRA